MKIKPLSDRVLVVGIEEKEKTGFQILESGASCNATKERRPVNLGSCCSPGQPTEF